METKTADFIKLIDQALEIAQQKQKEWPNERLNNVINGLQSIKNQALGEQLEPSQGRITLGLSREVADWIESLDSPLLKAVGAIEQYYQQFF